MNNTGVVLVITAATGLVVYLLLRAFGLEMKRTTKFAKWIIGTSLAVYLLWGKWLLMIAFAIPIGWLLLPAALHHKPLPYPRWLNYAFWIIVSVGCFADTMSSAHPTGMMFSFDAYLAYAFFPRHTASGKAGPDMPTAPEASGPRVPFDGLPPSHSAPSL